MIKLYSRPTRNGVLDSLQFAKSELIIASPYIRRIEMRWLLGQLKQPGFKNVAVKLITDIRLKSILGGSLEIEALLDLLKDNAMHRIVNLPRIHAKVFIADTAFAFISSGNLTGGGLDANYEYGVGIHDGQLAANVRTDILDYAALGNEIEIRTVIRLKEAVESVRPRFEAQQRTADISIRKEIGNRLRETEVEFIKAQVGERSPHSVFTEAVKFVLTKEALTTPHLHEAVRSLLPDICDDGLELIINGKPFGKKWKHQIRTVQAHLKKQGIVELDGKVWKIVNK